MWKRIWSDPVWSKVISAAIIAVAAGVGTYLLDWWPTIGSYFAKGLAFAGASSLVQNWFLAVIGLLALPTVVVLVALMWQLVGTGKPEAPNWEAYVSDVFLGLRWRWHYNGSTMSDLTTFCPHCDYQVFPANASAYNVIDRIAFSCDSCRAELGTFDESFHSLENKARRFAQQKIRTRSWNAKKVA
ncbi:MAG: hypothetical protein JSS59_01450 [Proteobacteria bacterium]|uniref:hypothetical protein n=1 Tax=Rudaea sp. TaxID=2136325 RepID=UPI003782D7DF|nr:hypothetical protein [Pseudomonadota bacterium]